MNLSIGLSLTRPSGPLGFNPASLFASGEVGAWYDPSDSSTVFQDAAGRNPAAVGDPVGLILDKSQGLTLGPELVTNGTFDDATGWTLMAGWAISGGTLQWSSGYNRVGFTVGAAAFQQGVSYKVSGTIVSRTTGNVTAYLALPLNPKVAAVQLPSGTGDFTLILSPTADVSQFGFEGASASGFIEIDNISVKELPGNHATQSTPTARPTLQTSGGLYYLDFDGVDDNLFTAAIDFTVSDALTTAAAVERQAALPGVIAELSSNWNTNTGSFLFFTGTTTNGQGNGFCAASRGTAAPNGNQFAFTSPVYPPPARAVLVASHDISDDYTKIRFDGTDSFIATGDKGFGNFSNTSVFIGSRGGTTTFAFDGLFFGIVLVSRLLTTAETDDLETYLAAKSGVTLP